MIRLAEGRRIALAALGLDQPRPVKPDVRHIARVIRRLGLIQIDYANVLIPAHYLVLFSRLGPYQRPRFDQLVYRRREFTEQWAHEASIVPMDTWPLLRHRRAAFRVRPYGFETFFRENPAYVDWVRDQVRDRGPLTAAELPAPEGVSRRVPEAWFGTIPRIVLEMLFARGVLAIAERLRNFARTYDLSERVIPAEHRDRWVEREDADRELIRRAARAYGIATADDLADYYRMPLRDAKPRIAELVRQGELAEVQVEGWRAAAYLETSARTPRKVEGARLISPFDPLVWYRRRALRLFEFHYRIEIYTPAEQRKYGYYVLPFLMGERLVARVDLKADRKVGRLLVLSTHFEPGVNATAVRRALSKELNMLANWLGLESSLK